MFPWLKPENESYGQQVPQRDGQRVNSGLGAYGKNANRQNQSDQDLMKAAQKHPYGKQDQENDRKYQEEREGNAYNHSKSENKLNQDKYNPYYDNQLQHNLKLNSRSGRNARNSYTPKSLRQGEGIDFENDYKHSILEKNKQQYKNFYRDNVSEFQKKMNGASIQSGDDKKAILQMQYQKDQNPTTGLHQRMSENVRHSQSPQQRQKEYADILKRQERNELQKNQKRRDEEFDYQNNNVNNYNNYRNKRDNEFEDRFSPQKQPVPQYQSVNEGKPQYPKKNVGFEDFQDREHGKQNYASEVDYEALSRENNHQLKGERFQSPQNHYQKSEHSKENQHQRHREQSPKSYSYKHNDRESQSPPDHKRHQKKRSDFEDDYKGVGGGQRRKWNDDENIDSNLIGQIQDKDDREQQLKRQRELKYYKDLEEEIGAKKGGGARDSFKRETNWNQNEKSMLDQLGDNYQRQKELQQMHKADIAEGLQQQIKEKRRLQRLEKEKQDLLDREYEEKVKAEVFELKAKYQVELSGKQLEIKSLRKNIEKKKQEQLQKQSELVLSKSSKSPPRNKVENSPRDYSNHPQQHQQNYHSRKTEEDRNHSSEHKRESADNLEDKGSSLNNNNHHHNSHDIHSQSRDLRQQKRHEDREKYRDSLYDKQQEYYQSMEVNKEWNPPNFWQYKESKNMQELSKLKEQLDMQTSLLQGDVSKIKQDAQVASEIKNQAFIDLENLKDSLKRQNMIENIKLRELRQNLGNLGYMQNDFLPSSSNQIGQFGAGGGGASFIAANQILGNQSSTRNINTNPNILNQTAFSQNINNSQLGASNFYGNNNNNFSTNNKYGLSQPDILDKLVSSNVNVYKFEGTRLNNKPTTNLDFKLEKRLNNVNLNKAEIQLLEVDNLLNNLRNGL